jgi:pyruvate dehydrogenase E2 component (dihydrolipoamide acetyltransferase)
MIEVIMPKMGDAMEEGTLVEWLKKEGDTVQAGETIGSIQTDKATLELEAPGSGVLTGLLIQAGETVPVGKPIAVILGKGEKLPEGWGGKKGAAREEKPTTEENEGKQKATKEVPEPAPEEEKAPSGVMPSIIESISQAPKRIKASPLAKRIAKEHGIDLSALKGSGPGGRIVERDVLKAVEAKVAFAKEAKVPTVAGTGAQKKVPLSRVRQIIAQRTTKAKQQIPHFYVTVKVDIGKILQLREMFEADESGKVSINDFVVKACACALRDMPLLNSSYAGDEVVLFEDINIGIAVAIEDGLLVPVIKNADKLTLRQLSTAAKQLAGKAREGKLVPDEVSGATFSISNMGMFDVDDFGAIINPPNVAILAISTGRKEAVVNEEEELEIRTRMNITGSFDHRVLDGAVGARFMNLVKEYLEHPTRLVD